MRRYLVYVASLLAVFSLLLPFYLRYVESQPLVFAGESYYNLRIASLIQKSGIPHYDLMLWQPRPYLINPYHLVLAGFFLLFTHIQTSILFPVLLGALSFVIFGMLLKSFSVSSHVTLASLVMLAFSPPFVHTFTVSSPIALSATIVLLGLYLLCSEQAFAKWLGILSLSIVPFFSFSFAVVSIVVLLSVEKYRKNAIAVLPVIVLTLVSLVLQLPTVHIPQIHLFFSDLGSQFGFGLFNVILCFLGLILAWPKKSGLLSWFVVGLSIISVSFLDLGSLVLLNYLVSVAAAFAFVRLLKMRWDLLQIRFMSITLIVCGLLFSFVTFETSLASSAPTEGLEQALSWLSTQETSAVFSHPSLGFFIQADAGKKVLADDLTIDQKILNDSNTLFYSRSLQKTKEILSKYNISHILISPEMKVGLVWNEPEQGLLFLLRNNETFKSVYNKSQVLVVSYSGG
ncbi:MAG: hypothetical protein V1837_07315 [Candidatus Woesearchaeota archaeon]